jgi:hypothetical protein
MSMCVQNRYRQYTPAENVASIIAHSQNFILPPKLIQANANNKLQ